MHQHHLQASTLRQVQIRAPIVLPANMQAWSGRLRVMTVRLASTGPQRAQIALPDVLPVAPASILQQGAHRMRPSAKIVRQASTSNRRASLLPPIASAVERASTHLPEATVLTTALTANAGNRHLKMQGPALSVPQGNFLPQATPFAVTALQARYRTNLHIFARLALQALFRLKLVEAVVKSAQVANTRRHLELSFAWLATSTRCQQTGAPTSPIVSARKITRVPMVVPALCARPARRILLGEQPRARFPQLFHSPLRILQVGNSLGTLMLKSNRPKETSSTPQVCNDLYHYAHPAKSQRYVSICFKG